VEEGNTGPVDWEEEEERLASRSLVAGDPAGWFDRLYAAAATGRVAMPWSRVQPHHLLVEWARDRGLTGGERRAVSETAIRLASTVVASLRPRG
jgi:hypothetical protein